MSTRRRAIIPGSSLMMIRRCFRHQHPEDFGRAMVDEFTDFARFGTDSLPSRPDAEVINEEPMGDPDARWGGEEIVYG